MIDFDFLDFFVQLHQRGGAIGRYEIYGRLSFLVNDPALIRQVVENKDERYSVPSHPYRLVEDSYTEEGKFILKLPRAQNSEDLLPNLVTQAKEVLLLFRKQLHTGSVNFTIFSKQLFFTTIVKSLFGLDLAEHSLDFATSARIIEECTANTERFDLAALPDDYREAYENASQKVNAIVSIIQEALQLPADKQVNDAIFKTLMNGYNGIAANLAWLAYHLAKDQKIQEELFQEIQNLPVFETLRYPDLTENKYLHALVLEALRFYPPSWVLGRTAKKDHQLGKYFVPQNSNVTICLYTLHCDPQYWKEPEQFIPRRFLAKNPYLPFTYMPFGKGQGRCPAQSFAILYLKMALIGILQGVRIEPTEEEYSPLGLVSLSTEEDICLGVERR